MGLFSKDITTFQDLYIHQLEDLYYAEQQITKALPKMIEKATDPMLKQGFETHLRETENQIERLKQVFQIEGMQPKGVTCPAIDGIIKEANEVAGEVADKQVLDAALINAAQAVEHYEICRYGTMVAWAKQLGKNDAATLFQATLDEEEATDRKLTQLAKGGINADAELAEARSRVRRLRRSEPPYRFRVALAGKEAGECRLERGSVVGDRSEERHRRAQLHGIDAAHDRLGAAARRGRCRRGRFDQPRSEQRMREIGACLGRVGDGVMLRHRAVAEPGDLREHEPHPVTGLASAAQLGKHLVVHGVLRLDETLQVMGVGRVGHGRSPRIANRRGCRGFRPLWERPMTSGGRRC